MSNNAYNTRLMDIVKVSAGYPLRSSARALLEGEVSFLQLRHVELGQPIFWNDVPKVTLPSGKAPRYLRQGDVIFASRGTRNFAYAIDSINFQAVCAPEFYLLDIRRPKELLPEFLAWQLNAPPLQRYFDVRSEGFGMKNVRRGTVEKITINLPSLEKQRAIVNLYETALEEERKLQALIHNRHKILNGIASGMQNGKVK